MLCGLCAQFEPIDEVAFTYTYTDHWYSSMRALLGPGFWGGGRVEQLVSLLDLPPTLLEAAGLPVPDELHGRSVLQLLNGEREGWPGEVFVQISESQVGRAIRPRGGP
jgi:hypothetical protein